MFKTGAAPKPPEADAANPKSLHDNRALTGGLNHGLTGQWWTRSTSWPRRSNLERELGEKVYTANGQRHKMLVQNILAHRNFKGKKASKAAELNPLVDIRRHGRCAVYRNQ